MHNGSYRYLECALADIVILVVKNIGKFFDVTNIGTFM